MQDYKILCVNFDRYGQSPEMSNCIKKLERCLHNNHISNNYKMTKTKSKQHPALSSLELKIQNRLKEIKSVIKKDLDSSKIIKLKNELTSLRAKLLNDTDTFSEICNIPSKITQIDSYLSKIRQVSSTVFTNTNNKTQTNDKDKLKVFGQTQRGIEIQEELSILREETKRKDLNLIEKENLTNTLIKLQNEITSSMEKFSKFDSIPVRLNQIENYLEKLKNKEEIKPKATETMKKTDVEEEKEDATNMEI